MIETYLYTAGSVIVVSLVSLVGLTLFSLREDLLRKYTFVLISIAVGALLGDAFIHLIPEALEEAANPLLASICIVGGLLFFFVIEKFLHWHHHGEDQHDHDLHPVGKLVIFSDGVHNFIDGIVIAASFMVSIPLGIATTIAVLLHEIPQEIGDFSVLLHAGYSKAKALWFNFLSALTALLGALVFFLLGSVVEAHMHYALAITAGGFIYIAVADLIPELHKTKNAKHSFYQLVAVVVGVLAMLALTVLE